MTGKSTIFIVDDHPIIRQGLALLINREPDLAVCGDAEEAAAALRHIEEMRPDLIVVDISLSGPDGLELLKNIRVRDANLPVLILSMLDESIYAERALRAGANGYIMKQEATERVLVAIRRILGGEIYVSDRMANRMLHRFAGGSELGYAVAGCGFDGSRAGSFPVDWRGAWHAPDCRAIAYQREDGESYRRISGEVVAEDARELVQRAIQWTIANKGS